VNNWCTWCGLTHGDDCDEQRRIEREADERDDLDARLREQHYDHLEQRGRDGEA
jgi:hypothetical protein